MAKISLRVYNRDIEGMIEAGQLDEAVAHCQHILMTFPMYVETYRLLGKAYLEGRRYADSADIFQRVLNAVPDDFVSHVGMSIIRDDEGRLDDAIWHMERAFQVQPSNAAIQAELRRLYGRRDGVEPPKIRLSREALANMYAQGELYSQAIAEIRSILADDPRRPDLQVLLARCYLRAGHKVEAAEVAAQLLKRYSYCVDALRVLVEVLPGTARAEETQTYRQRLRMLDPYSAFVTGSVFESDKVADAAVSLERLEYQPGQPPLQGSASQPAWAASLGIKLLDEEKPASPLAFSGEQMPEQSLGASISEEPAPAPAEQIPDFLREAGWRPLDSSISSAAVEELPAEDEIAKAEIPDWLKSMAPPQLSPETTEGEEESVEFDKMFAGLDALKGADNVFDEGALGDVAGPEASLAAERGDKLPLEEDNLSWSGISAAGASGLNEESEEHVPDWLKDLGGGEEFAQPSAQVVEEEHPEEIPDWLKGTVAEETPAAAAAEPVAEEEPVAGWEPEAAPAIPPVAEGEAKPLDISDDTLAWLESLAAKQGANPEELLTRPEERPRFVEEDRLGRSSELEEFSLEEEEQEEELAIFADESLEFMEEAGQVSETTAPLLDETTLQETPISFADETLAFAQESSEPVAAGAEEDITAWLKHLDETEEAETPGALPEEAPAPAEELPSWLKDLETEPESGADAAFSAPPVESQLPESLPQSEEIAWEDKAAPVEPPAPVAAEWMPIETPQEEAAPPVEKPTAEKPTEQAVFVGMKPSGQIRVPKPTGSLSPLPMQDKDSSALQNAQKALQSRDLNAAMKEYARLIKKGRLLDEVIHDLREAIYLFPVDVIVWQTLGDAYMRAGRLQEALDSYTKAEELLR